MRDICNRTSTFSFYGAASQVLAVARGAGSIKTILWVAHEVGDRSICTSAAVACAAKSSFAKGLLTLVMNIILCP